MRQGSERLEVGNIALPCAVFLLGVAGLLRLEWLLAGGLGFPFDDSWIFAQYARNLAEGHGFCFNIGEPSNGFTSFLWLLLVALGYKLTGGFVVPMKVMGVAFGLGCVVLAGLLLRELTEDEGQRQIGVWMVALCAPLLSASLSGLDTTLGTFTALMALWWHMRNRSSPSSRWALEGILWGIAVLARPENLALWLICLGIRVIQEMRLYPQRFRSAIVWLMCQVGIASLIVAPWIWLNFQLAGTPFPTTYLAKALPRQRAVDDLWGFPVGRMAMVLSSLIEFVLLLLSTQPVVVAFLLWRWLLRRQPVAFSSLLLVSFGLTAMQAFSNPSDYALVWSYFSRYVLTNLLLGLLGLALLLPSWRLVRVGVLVGSSLFLLACADLHPALVKFVRQVNVQAGQWVKRNLPKEETIATHDIGAIAFFSGHRVFDTQGLIHPEVVPFLWQKFPGSDLDIQWKDDLKLVQALRRRGIRYLLAIPEVFPLVVQWQETFEMEKVFPSEAAMRRGQRFMGVFRIRWDKMRAMAELGEKQWRK